MSQTPPTATRLPSSFPPVQRRTLNVLVVDDDEFMRLSLKEAVEDLGFVCRVAKDGAEALALHERGHFDIVLCDWMMPQMDGLELCRRVRAASPESCTYFILVTALADKEHLVKALRDGADGYLTKPIDVEELAARLEPAARAVTLSRRLVDTTESLRSDKEKALRIARIDPLTGINNRLCLNEDLESAMALSKRYGHRYSVGIFDVDLFKGYNDHWGHVAGDEMLRRVAEAMRLMVRQGDRIYRYGGDEFVVLLSGQRAGTGGVAADRLRQGVERLQIAHPVHQPWGIVTLSGGVAECKGRDDRTAEDWLRRADGALYRAKERGRNCVEVDTKAGGALYE